ncbi:MAG: GNAT family N-acetyltransferase [Acidimicrobiales bacterium]|jgi:predicted N-acetyltransferase YhbS
MTIRLARPEEFEAVGEITVQAYLSGRDTELGDYELTLRDVAGRAADCSVLVALDDRDEVVGAVTYVPGPDTVMSGFSDSEAAGIRVLAVRPDAQRSGIGRTLTEACLDQARADGHPRVILHSTEAMATARRLYEKIGFERRPELDEWVTQPPYSERQPLRLMAYVFTF